MAASKSTKPISNEIRSLIHNVLCFCEMEKEIGGAAIPYNRAVARTAVMTGVSEKSVYRIKKEMSDLESSLPTGTLAMANKQVMKDSIRKKTKKNINSVSNKKSYRQNKITQPAESDNTQVKNETVIEVVPSVVEEDIAADVSPQRPQVVKKILKRLDAPPQISISDRKIVIVKRDSKNQINNQQLFLLKQNPKTQSDCIQPVCEAPPASKQNDDAIVIPKIITMLPGKVLHKGSNQPVITFKNPQNTTENVHQKIENKNKIIALKSLPVTAQQITLVKKSKEDIVHLPNESQKIPSGLVQAKVVQSQRLRDISKDSKIVLMNDQHNTPDLKKIPDTVIQKVLENIRSTMPGNKKQKIYVKILVKNPPKDVNDAVEEQQYQIVNQDSEQIVSEEAIVSKEPVRKAVHPLPLSQARLANPILRKVMLEAGRQQVQGEKRKIVSVTSAANIPMKVIRVSNPVVQ